jgi:hypothetical protein
LSAAHTNGQEKRVIATTRISLWNRIAIRAFKGPRGTLIIYDSYGIHRAKPVKKGNFARKSILFQVDGELEAGEPLLINPEYIDNLDDRIKRYLGFGQPSGISLYPQTDLSTMPLSRQSEIFRFGTTIVFKPVLVCC